MIGAWEKPPEVSCCQDALEVLILDAATTLVESEEK